jgi:gluconolactonase
MPSDDILCDVTEGVMTITLNRPDKLNAFTPAMCSAMIAAFDRADDDDAIRVVFVTGAGRGFCAGADISEGASRFDVSRRLGSAGGGEIDYAREEIRDSGGRLALRIFASLKLVIGAVNGAAVGVGATMLLPMDIRLASTAARFGFPFVRRGLVPEACSTWFLPRGRHAAGDGMGRHGPRLPGRRGSPRVSCAACRRRTNSCPPHGLSPRRLRATRRRVGGPVAPAHVADARGRPPDAGPPPGEPSSVRSRSQRRREGRRDLVSGKTTAALWRSGLRRHAADLPVVDRTRLRLTQTFKGKGNEMIDMKVLATGLRFPEGPVALNDGSVVLVEIARGTVTRVAPDGKVSVIADLGGGPNGLASGPDGALYVCNNGGFEWHEEPGMLRPVGTPASYSGGRIERVDPKTGASRVLYDRCGDIKLKGPNDIVFDRNGGFYFTDLGKTRHRDRDQGSVYYAKADGSHIVEVVHPMLTPNGIGLSPNERTLYVAETEGGRLWAFDIAGPGVIARRPFPSPNGGRFLFNETGYHRFDSLAVDAEGNVCVATLVSGAITVVAPDGRLVRRVKTPDIYTTNICFGGRDMKTAYITLSGVGQLIALPWAEPGLKLKFAA